MGLELKLLKMLLQQNLFSQGLKGDPGTPLFASYTVTKACNLRCLHCHADARDAMPNELNLEEAKHAIDEMTDLGIQALLISGGEPILRKDFVLELADYCVDVGIIPAMLTNGTLLNRKVVWELKEAGMMALGIPIDFVEPEKHDKFRNVPNSFEKAVEAIRACIDLDLEVAVTTMALKSNFDDVPKIINFLADLGVKQFVIYDLVPIGRGKNIMDQAMSSEQRVSLMKYLHRMQEEKDMGFLVSGGDPIYPEIVWGMHRRSDNNPPNKLLNQFWIRNPIGCPAGILYFNLRPNGDVYPCPFLQIKAGNIRKQSLPEIWNKSKIFNELRERSMLKGECGKCEYRETCGGCRGRAYACYGDYLASDPICLHDLLLEQSVYPSTIERSEWCVG